jgi:hypothetical protein
MPAIISDRLWVRQAFMTRSIKNKTEDVGYKAQFFSTVSMKFTDSGPGGDICINPHPQYCRHTDLRPNAGTNKAASMKIEGKGQGRFMSEAVNDNMQVIQIRCGVPQHNSLNQFFMQFYNPAASRLAKSGRTTGIAFGAGQALAFVTQIVFWPLAGLSVLSNTYNGLMGKTRSRYYYLKPTMPLYWATAQNILNSISANNGLIPRIGGDTSPRLLGSDDYKYTKDELAQFARIAPDLFSASEPGTIDLFAVATRAQRLARKRELEYQRVLDRTTADIFKDIKATLGVPMPAPADKPFSTYWGQWLNTSMTMAAAGEAGLTNAIAAGAPAEGETTTVPAPGTTSFTEMVATTQQEASDMSKWWDAEMNDGSAWIGFRVNSTGEVGESFNNTTTQSELLGNINSKSSAARNTRFSLADGNISDGMLGKVLGGAISAIGDVVAGYAEQMSISGLAVLGGSAFVDIPDHYDSSDYQASTSSYTIVLNSPYGNPISRLMNIDIPLSCLLAIALPRSTGKASYTSPFLLEYYDKGRAQSRLAIVTGLSVRRGGGNTGWTGDHKPLRIDVTLDIKHLDNILHMPVTSGITLGTAVAGALAEGAGAAINAAPADSLGSTINTLAAGIVTNAFSDDTAFTDYMAVLGSMGLADQIYPMRKLKVALTKSAADFQTLTSKARFFATIAATTPGQILSIPYAGTIR